MLTYERPYWDKVSCIRGFIQVFVGQLPYDVPVSTDPSKYRYSPERMKKAMSYQSDEFPKEGRPGRRQSGKHSSLFKSFNYVQT